MRNQAFSLVRGFGFRSNWKCFNTQRFYNNKRYLYSFQSSYSVQKNERKFFIDNSSHSKNIHQSVDKASHFIVKPHINLQEIVENEELFIENVKLRGMEHMVDVKQIIIDYHDYKLKLKYLETLRHIRNELASIIPLVKLKKISDLSSDNTNDVKRRLTELRNYIYKQVNDTSTLKCDLFQNFILPCVENQDIISQENFDNNTKRKQLDLLLSAGKELKGFISQIEYDTNNIYQKMIEEAVKIPNKIDSNVSKSSNLPIRLKFVGEKKDILSKQDKIYQQDEICRRLDLLDFESAQIPSGSRFCYFKNEMVILELALIQYALSKLVSKYGFTALSVPELVRHQIIEGCGFQPRGNHSQIYSIENSDLSLIATSEVAIAGMHANNLMKESDLPKKYVAISHCFRKEVGHNAIDTGLYRLHQFSKVEMFIFCTPTQSQELFQQLVNIQEEIFTELGFHFQVMVMPVSDLGAPASIKIDIEAFMPGKNIYGEVSSASSCTDFQSRRLFIRFKKDTTNEYVHTLNGTAIAIPRVLLTIMEQNQYLTDDGRIGFTIPKVLHPFTHGLTHVEEKK